MKKTILIMCLAAIVAACTSKPVEQAWVKVEGNKFIAPDGSELVFRGLCFSDPVKLVRDGQWTERYFAEAADWGANIVRFAVHPAHLNSMGWDATFEAMDQGIQWTKQHGLYVIMDWHSIGNLKDAKFTSPMYNTTLEETFASHGDLIGKSLIPCHSERSRGIIADLLATGGSNAYTILKNGVKKMIYQTAWKENGEVAGLVEISMIIPEEMPHYVR